MLRENGAGKNYLIQHIAGSKAIIIDKINEKYQSIRSLQIWSLLQSLHRIPWRKPTPRQSSWSRSVRGIEQLSGVVQGNAASSEENTAISINLAEGAAKMRDRVNIFKLF